MAEVRSVIEITPIDDYNFLKDAYYGEGGFKDGSYLVPHPRETPEKYARRKALAYYLNYVAPVVNSHVNPVFRKEPEREWNDHALFSEFVKDADTLGTSFTRFMKRAALIAKLQAVAFIVIDNVSEQPGNMADVLKQRALPYAYIVQRNQVKEYKTNKAGRLIEFSYTVASETSSSDTATDTWKWTTTTWSCQYANGEEITNNHNLGRLPVIPLYSKPMEPGKVLPQSEFYNIAKTNQRLYNLCSEIDEIIRNQAFNILIYPLPEGESDIKEIIVSTENVLGWDGSLPNQPGYIVMDTGPLEQLRSERKDLIEEIYRMAELSHVTGVETKESGIAKQWDFEQANQVLTDFALNCEEAERSVAEVFGLWTNSSVDLSCKYSDDFGIVDVSAALDEVSKALDLQIGGKFNMEVKKKAAVVYLNDLPEDRFDAVIEHIEQQEEEQEQSDVFSTSATG
ncbi:hypothetical protein SRRS_07090 [Sporomusa rhizae]|uniref:hypothetical protein n=1 Tax=Sporomusa rhizae TaxID=357999 RepID=UPI00352B78CA